MSAVSPDEPPSAANHAVTPQGFWQKLAQALDTFLINRTKGAVPEIALRRSQYEIKRCRRLMLAAAPAEIAAAHAASRRAPPTTGARS